MQAQRKNQQPEPPSPSPLRKGSAFSVSGKEEAFQAQVRMKDQCKNSSRKKSSKSLSDDDSSDDDSSDDDSSDDDLSDMNAAQPKTVKGWGLQAPHGKSFDFQQKYGMLHSQKQVKQFHTKKT
jgi:hypothetical protein